MFGCLESCETVRTAGVSHLPALLPVSGLLGLVGFDAADVVWSTFHQRAHQIVGLFLRGGGRKEERDKEENDDRDDVILLKPQSAVTETLTDC